MPQILLKSAKATAKLVVIMAIGSVFSYICINEGVPEMVKRFILSISDDRLVILLMLNVFLLFLGCILDILVATIILVRCSSHGRRRGDQSASTWACCSSSTCPSVC